MSLNISPTLTAEMNSLIRRPASKVTVEQFMPTFTAKVSGVIIAANLVGAAIFLLAEKRRRSRRADAAPAPAN